MSLNPPINSSVAVPVPIFQTGQSFVIFESEFQTYLAAKDLRDVFANQADPRLSPMHPRYPGPQLAAVPLIPPVEPNLVAATAEERERVKFAITLYDRQMANITKERALRDKWKLAQATGILTLQAALREQPEALLLIKTEENPFLAWDTLQTLYRGAVGGIVTDKGMIQE
jgi:hypothetical protein